MTGPGVNRAPLGPWADQAACKITDDMPEARSQYIMSLMHPSDQSRLINEALERVAYSEFCSRCLVKSECGAHADEHNIKFGIWGGINRGTGRRGKHTRPGRKKEK